MWCTAVVGARPTHGSRPVSDGPEDGYGEESHHDSAKPFRSVSLAAMGDGLGVLAARASDLGIVQRGGGPKPLDAAHQVQRLPWPTSGCTIEVFVGAVARLPSDGSFSDPSRAATTGSGFASVGTVQLACPRSNGRVPSELVAPSWRTAAQLAEQQLRVLLLDRERAGGPGRRPPPGCG